MSADKRAEVTKEMLFDAAKCILWTLEGQYDDLREIKQRLGDINGQCGGLVGQFAGLLDRMDHLDFRLERIERRLDLVGE